MRELSARPAVVAGAGVAAAEDGGDRRGRAEEPPAKRVQTLSFKDVMGAQARPKGGRGFTFAGSKKG